VRLRYPPSANGPEIMQQLNPRVSMSFPSDVIESPQPMSNHHVGHSELFGQAFDTFIAYHEPVMDHDQD
jgi:hypothetical protein